MIYLKYNQEQEEDVVIWKPLEIVKEKCDNSKQVKCFFFLEENKEIYIPYVVYADDKISGWWSVWEAFNNKKEAENNLNKVIMTKREYRKYSQLHTRRPLHWPYPSWHQDCFLEKTGILEFKL